MLSLYPIISLSGLALKKKLNKNCQDIMNEFVTDDNYISEYMITEFNLEELCDYLKFSITPIPKLNILSLTCQTLRLHEDDMFKLYNRIAYKLYKENRDTFEEVNLDPDMIRDLLLSQSFQEFRIIIDATEMTEPQKTSFSKDFLKIKMDQIKQILFEDLLVELVENHGLKRSTIGVNDYRFVSPPKFGGQKSKNKRKPNKKRKRKTQKKRKRKTNKKRKPRKFISKNYNYK